MPQLIDKKQRNLLLASEQIKSIPLLQSYLQDNEKISDREVSVFPMNIRTLLTNVTLRGEFLQTARNEWKESPGAYRDLGADEKKWTKCSLCGTKNRYMHHIENTINHRQLNVGGDCVTEFSISKKDHVALRKQSLVIQRKIELEAYIPGITDELTEMETEIERLKLVIPKAMLTPYHQVVQRIMDHYATILKQGISSKNQQQIVQMKDLLKERRKHRDTYQQYNRKHQADLSYATTNILRWMRQERHHNQEIAAIYEIVQETGRIERISAHRIKEHGFLQRTLNSINRDYASLFIIDRVRPVEAQYDFYFTDFLENCRFSITHQRLLLEANLIPSEIQSLPDLTMKSEHQATLLQFSTLEMTDRNVQQVLILLQRKLSKRESTWQVIGFDIEFNEMMLRHRTKSEVITVPLRENLRQFQPLLAKEYPKLYDKWNALQGKPWVEEQKRDGYTKL